MVYRLISEEEYENMPEDKLSCFLYMYETAQRNYEAYNSQLKDSTDFSKSILQNLQSQYINCLAATASECGIEDVKAEWHSEDQNGTLIQIPIQRVFEDFTGRVQYAVTSTYIKRKKQVDLNVVLLTEGSRERIKFLIEKLRRAIDASALDDHKKDMARKKLDEILHNVSNRSVSLRVTLFAVATIANIIGFSADGVTLIKDGHEALNKIMALIAQDKDTQDNAVKRLNPPTMLLPAPVIDEKNDGTVLQS